VPKGKGKKDYKEKKKFQAKKAANEKFFLKFQQKLLTEFSFCKS